MWEKNELYVILAVVAISWLVLCFSPPMPSGNLSLVGLDMTSQPENVRNKGYYIRNKWKNPKIKISRHTKNIFFNL